ncbi:MAG: AAA family ATPase [Planctomycetota bacterium]
MSGFRKAKAEQAAIKMGLYGPAGSGKTFTALLLAEGLAKLDGRRVAYIDTERGTDFYCQAVPARAVHPEAFDFDAIYTRSIYEVLAEVKKLDPATHSVIVLDSVTHLWEAAIASFGGKLTSIGTIPMHAWGKIKKPYKDLMAVLLASPAHFIICGRQKTLYEEDETGELKSAGVTMRTEGETPYEPHILMRMEGIRPKKTHEVAQIVAYAEKDRTGVLAGRSFINPTFDSICKPLLPLLGATQGSIAPSDETAAKDAEAQSDAERARAEESAKLLSEFQARIALAGSEGQPTLKDIGKTITPQVKARMLPADVAALRECYQARESGQPVGGAK